MLLFLETGKP